MNPFTINLDGSCLQLALVGEITIEHARPLADSLKSTLLPEHTLAIDAAQLTRLDASALQILLACTQSAADTILLAPSKAWTDAFARYASPDPFRIA
jgi:ABC-type transporter Mla MlaB component